LSAAPTTQSTTSKSGSPVLSLSELRAFDPRAKERAGESDFCCPLCGDGKPVDQAHRSLSVNLENGVWHCHRCDQNGKLFDFWTERPAGGREQNRSYPRRMPARKPLTLPPLASCAAPPEALPVPIAQRLPMLAGSPAAQYLAGRGLPLALCEAAGIRYADNWHGRAAVVFPILNAGGFEVAAQGRYIAPLPGKIKFLTEGPKKLGVFAAPGAWAAGAITITEAPIDALSLTVCGYPALALVGKDWPNWLPALVASTRKRVYLAFDADAPESKAAHDVEAAAAKLAAELAYYDCRSERLRPSRAKDWNAQLLEVAQCRRLCSQLFKQVEFLEDDKPHPALSRAELLRRAGETLKALAAACVLADGPDAQGYNDDPLDPFAMDCLPLWSEMLDRLATAT